MAVAFSLVEVGCSSPRHNSRALYRWCSASVPVFVVIITVQVVQCVCAVIWPLPVFVVIITVSDGQIQIAIRFKLQLNHLW